MARITKDGEYYITVDDKLADMFMNDGWKVENMPSNVTESISSNENVSNNKIPTKDKKVFKIKK